MKLLFQIGFLDFGFIDILDILLVTFLLYQLYKLLRGSVAVKIFIGLLFIYLFYLIIRAVEMELLGSILGQFIGVGVLAAVILFQQEIRKFLLLVGQTTDVNNQKLQRIFQFGKNAKGDHGDINIVVKAAKELSGPRTGALIVFSKSASLQTYIESGDMIDAVLSKRLLVTIFNKYSPMHDGAVIIVGGRIRAARCIIPVSDNQNLPAQFGLRHRAAVGLTEVTDSAVIVVSEETGEMSLAIDGELKHNLSTAELRTTLNKYMYPEDEKILDRMRKKDAVATDA